MTVFNAWQPRFANYACQTNFHILVSVMFWQSPFVSLLNKIFYKLILLYSDSWRQSKQADILT